MFDRILVATDGSAIADRGLSEAISIAAQKGAELTVLHVVRLYAEMAAMQMASEGLFEQHLESKRNRGRLILERAASEAQAAGIPVRTMLQVAKVDRAAEAICTEAGEGYDLLVMGTHGRRGWDRFTLGSEAEEALRTASVPVLLVRGEKIAAGA